MVEIKNISKSFGDKRVLSDFSLCINDGERIMLTGASGCGKTTLLKIMLGIYSADSGTVSLPECTAVFQENRLVDSLSALANVMLVQKKPDKKTAVEILSALLPADSLDNPISTLSGGMKRRVAIARALVCDRPFLIMDEPFSGLDDGTKESAAEFICKKAAGKTVLFVSHDKEDAVLLNAKIVEMK